MKIITILVASIFLFGGIVANATERKHRSSGDFRNTEPIVFTERGIEFFVFADGQFDFNTHPSNDDLYYKSGRRNGPNKTYGAHGNDQKWNNGVEVEHDRYGQIRRIGNVFISYDSNNRIKKIGSVYMHYNRYGLTQVGDLHIVYNHHRQIVDMYGAVNRSNDNQYNSRSYDNHNDCHSNNIKPNKVVASLGIRINR